MVEVYIGIGSNIGNREANIFKAISELSGCLDKICYSRFYTTEPRDYLDQDFFLNTVVMGQTDYPPFELLKEMQMIERSGGRLRDKKIPKGPRTIDLDLLLFGTQVIDSDILNVPHLSMTERKFVLIPLLELNGDLVNPRTGDSFYMALNNIEKQGVYCSSLYHYNMLFS